jgi:AmpD protein
LFNPIGDPVGDLVGGARRIRGIAVEEQIVEHQWAAATQIPSPNFDRRPAGEVSLIIVHGISLPEGQFGGDEIVQLFTNSLDTNRRGLEDLAGVEVSSHLLIRRDGEVIQFVPFNQRAWHAGQSTFAGRAHCNDYSVGIELEGTDHTPYEIEQYEQLATICRHLMAHYGASEIRGHTHVAPDRKTDPGPAFDWLRLQRGIATRN